VARGGQAFSLLLLTPNTDGAAHLFAHPRLAVPAPAPLPAAGPAGVAGKPGPPLFLSYPHFCDADPRLVAGVEGLECRPKRHDLFLDVGKS
jgi:hypothetical protein